MGVGLAGTVSNMYVCICVCVFWVAASRWLRRKFCKVKVKSFALLKIQSDKVRNVLLLLLSHVVLYSVSACYCCCCFHYTAILVSLKVDLNSNEFFFPHFIDNKSSFAFFYLEKKNNHYLEKYYEPKNQKIYIKVLVFVN